MYLPMACQAFRRCQRRMAKGRTAAAKSSSLFQMHDPRMPGARETAARRVRESRGDLPRDDVRDQSEAEFREGGAQALAG